MAKFNPSTRVVGTTFESVHANGHLKSSLRLAPLAGGARAHCFFHVLKELTEYLKQKQISSWSKQLGKVL